MHRTTTLKLGNTEITASGVELNKLTGVNVDVDKDAINALSGISSNIQTQLDTRYTKTQCDETFAPIDGHLSITTVGSLTEGSISGNFGAINVGSNTIETTGTVSAGNVTVDNIILNGSTIGYTGDSDLITLASDSVTISGRLTTTDLTLNGTAVTASATDINKLSTLTATSAELNVLDNIDVSTSELNYLKGVTSNVGTFMNDVYTKSEADDRYAIKDVTNGIIEVVH